MRLCAFTSGLVVLSSACAFISSRTAQRIPRIGYLSPGPREAFAELVDAFLAGLGDLGYIEGQTIAIEWRFTGQGKDAQFPEMAAELVGLPVDLIVAAGSTPAAQAAKRATSTVPIVAVVSKPVETGLVASLARPGGNLTGLNGAPPGLRSKHLELLRDVVPGLRRVGALVDATNPAYDIFHWEEVLASADQAGIQVYRIDLRSAEDVETALDTAVSDQVDAVLDVQNPLLLPLRERLGALLLQRRLPGLFADRAYVTADALMSYAPNRPAQQRRAAAYVDKVLRGAKPAELPVEQPTLWDFVFNLKTAATLGATIGLDVAPLVTEWIQ